MIARASAGSVFFFGMLLGSLSLMVVEVPQARAQFVCIGNATGAAVPPGTADGAGATAFPSNSVACGDGAHADGGGTVVGSSAGSGSTGLNNSFGFLAGSSTLGDVNNSFGRLTGVTVTGDNNNAFGDSAGSNVTGSNNSAFGGHAAGEFVTGSGNSALGSASGHVVIGDNNSAVGNGAGSFVTGSNNIAIGNGAGSGASQVNPLVVSNTVAIGNGATASADGAVAIGNGAQATRPNQVALGTSNNTYTMAGITSSASRAAQVGPTQLVTSDVNGNLATFTPAALGLASSSDLASINSQLGTINGHLLDMDNRINKAFNGVAMGFAMAGVPWLTPGETFAVSGNWGTFQSTNGLALNAALRLGSHIQANGGIAYGANGGGTGGRLGLRIGW
jgi:hypothetical protein